MRRSVRQPEALPGEHFACACCGALACKPKTQHWVPGSVCIYTSAYCARQVLGVNWLVLLTRLGIPGSILADDMGLVRTALFVRLEHGFAIDYACLHASRCRGTARSYV